MGCTQVPPTSPPHRLPTSIPPPLRYAETCDLTIYVEAATSDFAWQAALRAITYHNGATASLGTRAVSLSAGQAMPNCRSNGLVLAVSILDAPVADSPAPTPEPLGGSSLSQTPFPPFNLLPLGSSVTSGAGAAVVTVTAAAAFVAVMAALAL